MSAPHETLRDEVVADLAAGGIKARRYVGETLTPPCVIVAPGDPHIERATSGRAVPFGHQLVRLTVLCVAAKDGAKRSDEAIDRLTGEVLAVLDDRDRDVITVTAPGVVPLIRSTGARYVASAVTIEEVTEA